MGKERKMQWDWDEKTLKRERFILFTDLDERRGLGVKWGCVGFWGNQGSSIKELAQGCANPLPLLLPSPPDPALAICKVNPSASAFQGLPAMTDVTLWNTAPEMRNT